jgi:hypothetical protein
MGAKRVPVGDSAAGGEGRGCDVDGVEAVEAGMGAEPHDGPRHVSQRRDAEGSTCGRDTEQHARAVGAFGAAGKQRVYAEHGDVLELALGGRAVDGDVGSSRKCRSAALWFL